MGQSGDDADHRPGGAGASPRDERDSLFVLAGIRPEGRGEFEKVRVRNVSSGGLMAETREDYAANDRIELSLEAIGTIGGVVAWAESGRIGVAFDHPIDKSLARKSVGGGNDDQSLFRPVPATHRRPPLKRG